VPLVTPFGRKWLSVGWSSHLAFMGVLVDSPVAYGLIINYQIARCVAGSLLAVSFQPHVAAVQSDPREEMLPSLLVARGLVDVFTSLSSLTDLLLHVSQADIFLLSCAATAAADMIFTSWLLKETLRAKKKDKDITVTVTSQLGGARLRL